MNTTKPELSEYDKQAQDFLEKTGATITMEFKGHYNYFGDDEYSRDVYSITLNRVGKNPYNFDFGQSLSCSAVTKNNCKSWNLLPIEKDIIKPTKHYFSMDCSIAIAEHLKKRQWKGRQAPTPYCILASFDGYDLGTFQDFCDNFGYDNDSIKAREIYFRCQEQVANIQRLFNSEELELLSEIS